MLKDHAVKHKVNQTTYAKAFKLLLDEPCTCHEIAEETGLHLVTVQSLMRVLKAHKVVHIVAWEKDTLGRDTTAVFAFGVGRDKPRGRRTPAQRQADHRARKVMRTLSAATAGALA